MRRFRRFLRHLSGLAGEIWGYAWRNRAWWLIPVTVVLLLAGLLIAVGSGASPFIYTIF